MMTTLALASTADLVQELSTRCPVMVVAYMEYIEGAQGMDTKVFAVGDLVSTTGLIEIIKHRQQEIITRILRS